MDIIKAKALKVGDIVHCPADRGELAHSGRVEHVGETECTHTGGNPFIWITVRPRKSHASVCGRPIDWHSLFTEIC